MSGWKTWVGAIGLVLVGAYQISEGNPEQGFQRLAEAMVLIGLGHKIEKAGGGK